MSVAKKILIIGPSWIGDMVMAQSLFKCLKQRIPYSQIDVLSPEWCSALLYRMPEVSKVIDMPVGHGKLELKVRRQLAYKLREENYHQAILIPNSFKSALIPLFAKIPVRTGWLGELRWGLLNNARKLDKTKYRRQVERFAALAYPKGETLPEKIPQPELTISQANVDVVIKKYAIKKHGQRILALCPGAEYGPAKRWPVKHFAELAKQYLAEDWQVWLFGSKKEVQMAQDIQSLTDGRCTSFVGKTDLEDAVDLLSLTDVVVSNDSGLMHIAAALKKPQVVLYGSTAEHFAPPLNDHAKSLHLDLECRPCGKRTCPLGHTKCLQDIHPQQVDAAIQSLSNVRIAEVC